MGEDYSQSGEQKHILKYFKNYTGVYACFGSNNGIFLSNTYALALSGWSGYCFEASTAAFEQLKMNYKPLRRVKLYNAAITPDIDGEIEFFESGTHLGQGDVSLLSTTQESELKRWEGSNNHFTKTKVQAIAFNTWYQSLDDKKIDMISVDIEGLDLPLLFQMNLTEMETKLICLEWNSNEIVKEQMVSYCKAHGLTELLLQNAENIILSK